MNLHQNEINEVVKLQEKVFSIDSENFEEISKDIMDSPYIGTKAGLLQLLNTLKVGSKMRPKSFELFFQIMKMITDITKQHFTDYEITAIFSDDFSLLKLYEIGLIDYKSISRMIKAFPSMVSFFSNEIKENDEVLFNSIGNNSQPDKAEEKKEFRSKGHNHNEIAEVIRNDNISLFSEMISQSNMDLNSFVPFSEYEQCKLLMNKTTLIEYAAFFGSILIFKFLYLNQAKFPSRIAYYAVAGGNYEIIHIVEKEKSSFRGCLDVAINFHRNEVVEYLVNELYFEFNMVSLCNSVESYNLEVFYNYFPKLLETKIDRFGNDLLDVASINGRLDIVQFICSLEEIDVNQQHFYAFF